MSRTETARNERIVRLHDAGMPFPEIAKVIFREFPESHPKGKPLSRQRVRELYEREANGVMPRSERVRREQRAGK